MFVLLGNKMNTIYERFKEVPEALFVSIGFFKRERLELRVA